MFDLKFIHPIKLNFLKPTLVGNSFLCVPTDSDINNFSSSESRMLLYYKELADKFDKLIENYQMFRHLSWTEQDRDISLHDFYNIK